MKIHLISVFPVMQESIYLAIDFATLWQENRYEAENVFDNPYGVGFHCKCTRNTG